MSEFTVSMVTGFINRACEVRRVTNSTVYNLYWSITLLLLYTNTDGLLNICTLCKWLEVMELVTFL